ncbi:MAG: phage portal protein [Mesorhizobium sp.]|uniref:phage portal protein n=1 Tax=Mesorhizobium sp. TaxID=1871066 RepID=UPI00121A5345|nr:phage portal protein [Mesorhizobium sp.]TIN36838.1 MAG: phage portal protein [Mesorhizobium sp.]TJU86683.1 MAG: phage portal protein [Mesorhizobium sp.]
MKSRLNWLDRAIGVVSPKTALRRGLARYAIDATRAYDGAARGRLTEGWRTRATSADTEIGAALPLLRDRQRDLERNNPHARKAKTVWQNNLVGTGIRPRAKDGDATAKRAIELWGEWAKRADADNQLDIYGLIELAVGTMISGGDTLIRRRLRLASDGLKIPLQLQVMEGDLLDHTKNGVINPGRTVVQGVEFDQIENRTAYWMFQQHPGNTNITGLGSLVSRPVPASEIIHLYRKERTQTRGVPWGSAVVREFRDFDDYQAAEIIRKKTEACVVAIVLGADEGQEGIAPSIVDANGVPVESFEPGLIAYAHGGKDIKFNSPSSMGGFPDYKKATLHTVAAGYLVPYELLTGDLSEVNFSSARVGLVEFRRLVETVQWLTIIPMMLDKVWAWFCEAAYFAGELPTADIPIEWDPPEFDSVNPIDDANADLINIRSGKMTLFEAIAKRGRDPIAVLEEHAVVAKLLDKLGLIFDSDPRRVSKGGNEQPSTSQQANEAVNTQPKPGRLQAVK